MATNAGEVKIRLAAQSKEFTNSLKLALTQIRALKREALDLNQTLRSVRRIALTDQLKGAQRLLNGLTTSAAQLKKQFPNSIPKTYSQSLNTASTAAKQLSAQQKEVAKQAQFKLQRTSISQVLGLGGKSIADSTVKEFKAARSALSGELQRLGATFNSATPNQFAQAIKNIGATGPKAFNEVGKAANRSSASIQKNNRSITLLVAKFALLVFAIQTVGTIIDSTIGAALRTVDDFRIATIESAVGLTRIADLSKVAGSTIRSAFQQNLKFVQGIFLDLELAAQDFFATGGELQEGFNQFAQQGIVLGRDQIQLLGGLVDTIKLTTRGISAQGQVAQEIRALLTGTVNRGTQLGIALRNAGADAQVLAQQIRETGSLAPLEPFVSAISAASGEIRQTLTSALATTKSLLTQITRFALEQVFDDVVDSVQEFNALLVKNRDTFAAIANIVVSRIVNGVKSFFKELGLVTDSADELGGQLLPIIVFGVDLIKEGFLIIGKLVGLSLVGLALIVQKLREISEFSITKPFTDFGSSVVDAFNRVRTGQPSPIIDADQIEKDGKKSVGIIQELKDNIDALTNTALGALGQGDSGGLLKAAGLDPNSDDVKRIIQQFTDLRAELAKVNAFPVKDLITEEEIARQREAIQNEQALNELRSKLRQEQIKNELTARVAQLNEELRILKQNVTAELLTTEEASAQRAVLEDRIIGARTGAARRLASEEETIGNQRVVNLIREQNIEIDQIELRKIAQSIDETGLKNTIDKVKALQEIKDLETESTEVGNERLQSQIEFNQELEKQLRLLKESANLRPLGTTQDEADRKKLTIDTANLIRDAQERANEQGVTLSDTQKTAIGDTQQQLFDTTQFRKEIREISETISDSFKNIVIRLSQGSLDLRQGLQGLSAQLLDQGLKGLFDNLTAGFEKLFEKLGTEVSKQAGQALAVGLGLLFAVLSRIGNDSSFTPGAGGGSGSIVESTQAVRGVIGGDTSIAIADINIGLQEALIPTNNILSTIERNTRSLAELNLSIDPDQLSQSIQNQIADILNTALLQVGP